MTAIASQPPVPERLALDETAGLAAGSAPIACSYVPKTGREDPDRCYR